MLCGGSVIVENKNGEILMQKRADDGSWAYAGGAVELYENTQDAAKRELFEETGLEALELELLGVFSGERLKHVYPNGDIASVIDIVYICRQYCGTLKMQEDEVTQLRFFPIDALPAPISQTTKPALDEYIRLRRNDK